MQEKKQHDEKKHSHRQYGRLRRAVHVTCEISTDARTRTHAHARTGENSHMYHGIKSFLWFRVRSQPLLSQQGAACSRRARQKADKAALTRHHIQHALVALCTNLPPSRAHRRKPVRSQPLALLLRPPSASCAARGVGSPSSAAAGSTSAAAVPALLLLHGQAGRWRRAYDGSMARHISSSSTWSSHYSHAVIRVQRETFEICW